MTAFGQLKGFYESFTIFVSKKRNENEGQSEIRRINYTNAYYY
jgi:hypothetical protein